MRLEEIGLDSKYYDEIIALYKRSFPENERRDLTPILKDESDDDELLGLIDNDEVLGFVVLLNHNDIAHIIYFAIEEKYRDHGYGSKIIQMIKERYPDKRILADVEEPEEDCDNIEQRIKRINFYLRNGFKKSDVYYEWLDEDYMIMVANGDIDDKEFSDFWDYIYTKHTDFNY